jgi:tetratricopeptide (TPR) repeat protein
MVKKKSPQTSVSQEENLQAQHILERYHQIATDLRESKDQEQTEAVLTEINTLPEGAQIALLKALAKEHHVDAADVVAALNELSPLKTVRKEARRSLIQLEGAKISPQWQSPLDHTPPIGLIQPGTNPPRFWKGLVSDTRAMGQVQLLLFWEQGEDYKEIRILGFYLEFEEIGVKDFFTALDDKLGIDQFIAELGTKAPDLKMKDCSLRAGRRLLLKALKVHTENGTKPPFEYQSHVSLINQLVIEIPEEESELHEDEALDAEAKDRIDLHGLTPREVVVNFVEFWVDEEYDLAYELLASGSSLRDGLSRDEWVERRETWAEEAVPGALEPNFIYEREQPQSKIWLPDLWTVNYSATHKEVVAGWSIELERLPENDTLPELPQATMVYEETNRRWFWMSYTLIQEDGEWRIQRMTDETANAQTLSIEELQAKTQELDRYMVDFSQRFTPQEIQELKDEDAATYLGQLIMHAMEGACYTDALIKKLPLDQSLYSEAAAHMFTIMQYERCLAYLIPMTRRFLQGRGLFLRRIADIQEKLSERYFYKEDDKRGELYQELAERSLHESLDVENSFEAHMALVDLLIEDEEEIDHVEKHLLAAKELMNGPEEEAHVQVHLGEIATVREQFKEALSHYQRVLDLKPDSAEAWFDVGEAHEALEHFEEAETSYKRALELEPDAIGYYYTLSQLYSDNARPTQAVATIEQGIVANPDSAPLHVYLAEIYMERGDYHRAEEYISKAERLDPESELVIRYRQMLNIRKSKQSYTMHKLNKPKRKRR